MRAVMLAALIASIGAPTTLAAQTAPTAQAPALANGVGSAFELTFWQSVAGSDDQALFDAYLARYPDGTFSGLARAKIAALQRALPVVAPVQEPVVAGVQAAVQPAVAAPDAVPVLAPVPAAVPVVFPAPEPAPALVPTPAVVIAAPAPAPASGVVMPQMADMIPANAVPVPAEPSTPLARLLAQLRGTVAAPVEAASAAPVQLAAAPAPVPAVPLLGPVASAPAAYASARPAMLPVPDVAIPAHFCSSDARNAFHNNAYRPAVEAATHNNDAAVTYLRQLQQTYDRGQLGRDTAALNAIAAEARAYQAEAARAYTVQAALVRQFDALMAVPLHACLASAQ